MEVIADERVYNASFAKEYSHLSEEAGIEYDFEDIFEEYFDFLEEAKEWELVVESCDKMLEVFAWEELLPSQFMFRKGNALEQLGRLEDALAFGKEWLALYPKDYYGAASNVFLMIAMGKMEEAKELTEQYLGKDLVCDKATDTFFMAATRLYEITEDSHAKERVAKKLAEYESLK